MPKDLLRLLKAADLFIGLTDEQLQRLIDISRETTFGANEVIFAQGDEGDNLYIIRQGQVDIRVESEPGSSRSRSIWAKDRSSVRWALIDYGRRSATVHQHHEKTRSWM